MFINAGQVSDNIGNFNTGSYAGVFVVDIGTTPPTALGYLDSSNITDPSVSPEIFVNYSDDPGIDQTTLKSSNLIVTGPNGYHQPVTLLSVDSPDGSSADAAYQLATPPGGWQTGNNGMYSVVLQPNQVYDLSGNVMPTQTLTTFTVNVAPTVDATIEPVTPNPASPGLDQVTIQFTQPVSNFNSQSLTLSKDGGPNLLDGTQGLTTSDGVTYVLSGLGGLTTQTGRYTLTLTALGSGITDAAGGLLGADASTTFGIDGTPPVAAAKAPDITAPGTQPAVFTVTYTDNNAVNAATINTGNVAVTAPDGTTRVAALMSIDSGMSGPVRVATYSIPAPAGGWSTGNEGSYVINMVGGEVSDLNGNSIPAGAIGAFNVKIGAPDTTPPAVTGAAPNITTAGTQAETFSITYTDASAVNASTIASGNVTVTAPNGTTQPASLVSLDSTLDGPVRVAIYSIPAPAGGWAAASNGVYSINMAPGQVADVYGNAVPAQLITAFSVNIVAPVDTTPPTATGSAPNITFAGTQPESFTITYTDASAVKASTIASGNLQITAPNGSSQRATLVSVDSTANGPVRVATYSIPAPAGGWTAYNNGTYAISMRGGQVSDVQGNFVPVEFITSFSVSVPDTQGPVPTASAPNITAAGTQVETFTVTYTDATAVKASTIASGNILVSGPNGYSQNSTLVKIDSSANGPVRVATYTVPAPAGGWSAAYNGPYAIRMRSNQVSDTLGNYAFVQFIAPFNVNIPPKISSISPNPVTGSASAQNLTINGSNLTAAATVTLRNLTTGAAVNPTIVSASASAIIVSNVFGVGAGNWTAQVSNGTLASGAVSFSVVAPTPALAITVSPSPVTGKTAALTAANGGSNAKTLFKWAATKLPSGAAAPTFSANNTNAAQKSTVTFFKAGSYTLTLTSTTGTTVKTATVTFTVNQTLSSIKLSPTSATVTNGKTQQFTATAKDQFGAAMAAQPAFTWSIAGGGVGSISTTGSIPPPPRAAGRPP